MTRPLIGRRACAACRSDNELLITCADGGARCPACCARAGWCEDCGGRIRSVLAQADAETLLNAVRYATQADTLEERLRGWSALCNLARTAHPGTPLADEVRAARAENAYLREWIRSECSVADADINAAMAADVAKAARRKAKADADAEAETALLAAVAATDD